MSVPHIRDLYADPTPPKPRVPTVETGDELVAVVSGLQPKVLREFLEESYGTVSLGIRLIDEVRIARAPQPAIDALHMFITARVIYTEGRYFRTEWNGREYGTVTDHLLDPMMPLAQLFTLPLSPGESRWIPLTQTTTNPFDPLDSPTGEYLRRRVALQRMAGRAGVPASQARKAAKATTELEPYAVAHAQHALGTIRSAVADAPEE